MRLLIILVPTVDGVGLVLIALIAITLVVIIRCQQQKYRGSKVQPAVI